MFEAIRNCVRSAMYLKPCVCILHTTPFWLKYSWRFEPPHSCGSLLLFCWHWESTSGRRHLALRGLEPNWLTDEVRSNLIVFRFFVGHVSSTRPGVSSRTTNPQSPELKASSAESFPETPKRSDSFWSFGGIQATIFHRDVWDFCRNFAVRKSHSLKRAGNFLALSLNFIPTGEKARTICKLFRHLFT